MVIVFNTEESSENSSWWIYLLTAVGTKLFIISAIIIQKCNKKKRRKNSIKSNSIGAPLTATRAYSVYRSVTPPVPMTASTPRFSAENPVPFPMLLDPPPAHPRPSDLGDPYDSFQDKYKPSAGIWSSIKSLERRKSRVSVERSTSPTSTIELPDLIISLPNSKCIKLKQLYQNSKVYSESNI